VVPARLENENPLGWASFDYSALLFKINLKMKVKQQIREKFRNLLLKIFIKRLNPVMK
jgi:hypothetical protein